MSACGDMPHTNEVGVMLRKRIRYGIGVLLKHTLNPLTRRIAHSSFGPFSIIQHVGRRSGKHYETPIIVGHLGKDFVIELTYGPEVDWYKNVQAAGGCALIWHGKSYVINHLEPLDAETGRNAFPLPAQLILLLLQRQHFVKMQIASPAG
jgi:hypothetical protein